MDASFIRVEERNDNVEAKAPKKRRIRLPNLNRPRCKSEGCGKHRLKGGYCVSHGGGTRCLVDGCDKISQVDRKCACHAGGYRLCDS